MAWTYDTATLATSTLTQVRLLIQDTQTARQLFQDEEINWAISAEANVYTAAAALCDMLVAKAGNVKSKSVADTSITYDVQMYRGLASILRSRGAGHQVPFAGGISISDKEVQQQDTDAVQPRLFRGLADNPNANTPAPRASDSPLTRVP
jgi:hypothetical protein